MMNPLAQIQNPFRSAIVSDPWHWDAVDVPEIHGDAFNLIRRALVYVRENHQSTSVLFYGLAGSGKTHLLARLQAYLAGLLKVYGPAPPAVFISVRLQTSPQMMWRHLRNRFGEDLLRATTDGRSQLERILLSRISTINPRIGEPRAWLEGIQRESRTSTAAVEEIEEELDRLDQEAGIHDRDLLTIIGHLLTGLHRRDARAWLRGESLPEAALAQLGVNVDQEGEPEERARRMTLSLTRLMGSDIPLVFCFDQVEALQTHPDDMAGLHKFGQMVSFLRDETRNALLISCILSDFLMTLDQAIISTDRDRLAVFGERSLNPLTPAEAERLIEARIESRPELRALRPAERDRFWPLDKSDIEEAFKQKKNSPRALLSFCADKFDALSNSATTTTSTSPGEFLSQTLEERLEQSASTATSDQTDQIVTHGLPLLLRLIDPRWEVKAIAKFRDADLVFEGPLGRINISLCNHRNMTSLAGKLRRLRDQVKEQVLEEAAREKFVLLRDSRLPIGAGAKKTREHREELIAQGFQWVAAPAEMLAALDTLRSLLSDSKAGDLSNGGESITPATLQEWLARNLDSRLSPLRELLDSILPQSGLSNESDFDLCEDISELLFNHHLVSVADVACKLDREDDVIEACARRHPERFGLLNGPPPVLFQLTIQAGEASPE